MTWPCSCRRGFWGLEILEKRPHLDRTVAVYVLIVGACFIHSSALFIIKTRMPEARALRISIRQIRPPFNFCGPREGFLTYFFFF